MWIGNVCLRKFRTSIALDIFLETVFKWSLHVTCLFKVRPRKLNIRTLSTVILFIEIGHFIFLRLLWKTINFVLLTFSDNLLHASQSVL